MKFVSDNKFLLMGYSLALILVIKSMASDRFEWLFAATLLFLVGLIAHAAANDIGF